MPRPPLPPPGPDRDRELAHRPRYGYRAAASVGNLVGALMKSEDIQRLRRFQKVAGALKEALDERRLARLKPVHLASGTLTIEVADGPLLAEMRQHHHHVVLAALAAHGTGVSRLVWRLARARA